MLALVSGGGSLTGKDVARGVVLDRVGVDTKSVVDLVGKSGRVLTSKARVGTSKARSATKAGSTTVGVLARLVDRASVAAEDTCTRARSVACVTESVLQ